MACRGRPRCGSGPPRRPRRRANFDSGGRSSIRFSRDGVRRVRQQRLARAPGRADHVAVGHRRERLPAEVLARPVDDAVDSGVVVDFVEQHACRLGAVGASVLLNLQPVRERWNRRLKDDDDAVREDDGEDDAPRPQRRGESNSSTSVPLASSTLETRPRNLPPPERLSRRPPNDRLCPPRERTTGPGVAVSPPRPPRRQYCSSARPSSGRGANTRRCHVTFDAENGRRPRAGPRNRRSYRRSSLVARRIVRFGEVTLS